MTFAEEFVEVVLERTNCGRVLTYPGSPPRHLYEAVRDSDRAALEQVVREQHLLHLVQARYYRNLEEGREAVPVVIVSGEMGEAMAFQPLLAGSITAPCLVVVAESAFGHGDGAFAVAHQTDRGLTPDRLGDDRDLLMNHENVTDRILLEDRDLDPVVDLIDRIRATRGVGIVHVPEYVSDPVDGLEELSRHVPERIPIDRLGDRWREAERPLLLAGRGAIRDDHRAAIEALADRSGAPIVTSMPMDGRFDRHCVGRIGIVGDEAANRAFGEADFALALGCSLSNVVTSFDPEHVRAFQEKACQVEVNARRRSVFAGSWVHADVGEVLERLPDRPGRRWYDGTQGSNAVVDDLPEEIVELGAAIRETRPDAVVSFGVGNACIWLPYALGSDVKKWISRSGSMGEVVAGLDRDDDPILVLGDGELEMDLSLLVEARYRVENATIVVVNNERLGLVSDRQDREFGEVLTPKENPVDYDRLGAAFEGVESYSVDDADDVRAVVSTALERSEISVVEIRIDDPPIGEVFDPFTLPGLE